jgi:MYXO-CTERM domain-containing protein
MRPIFVVMLSAAIAGGYVSAAAVAENISGKVTFDSASDLALFHTQGSAVLWGTGGINNTGAVSNDPLVSQPRSTLTYQPRSFSMHDQNDTLQLSVMFRYTQITQLSNGGGIGVDVAGVRLYADPNPSAFLARSLSVAYHEAQFSIDGPITYSIDIESYTGSSGSGQRHDISPLIDGHWYRFRTTFSFGAGHKNQFHVALDDFGTTGLSFAGTHSQLGPVGPASPSFTLFDDSTAWAGIILGQANGKGGDRHDDFIYQVPEPAPVGLAALGALGAAAWGRRRRNRAAGWRTVASR